MAGQIWPATCGSGPAVHTRAIPIGQMKAEGIHWVEAVVSCAEDLSWSRAGSYDLPQME
jgi:hypothetical protein